ncbi:aromatic-amino-acid protein [[Candida] boidinii]|nr:aromatic-amino-acid protein [[Candida] boidinii]
MTGPISFSHLYSKECNSRERTLLDSSLKYASDPSIAFLGGGLPRPEFFPWNEISASSPLPPFVNGITSHCTSVKGKDPKDSLATTIYKNQFSTGDAAADIELNRALQYSDSAGFSELVDFIKEHNKIVHHIPHGDWNVILTAGSTQSIDSTIRTFCDRGDYVILEEYSYPTSMENLKSMGLKFLSAPMDNNGIIPEKLREVLLNHKGKMPKFLYTVPTGQNPTGCVISDERKEQIYRIAQEFDFLIVEDDPYYFLQFDKYATNAEPSELSREEFVSSLTKSFLDFDCDGRVIRLESTSKVLAPGARVGWIVAQNSFLDAYVKLHEFTMFGVSGFSQTLLNGLFNRWGQNGYLDWLKGLRKEYTKKRNDATELIYKLFPMDITKFDPPSAGMFMMLKFDTSKHPEFETKFNSDPIEVETHLYHEGIKNGCLMIPGSSFIVPGFTVESNEIFFRCAYAAPDYATLEKGLTRFSNVIKNEFKCK